jgi:hypothetical protein
VKYPNNFRDRQIMLIAAIVIAGIMLVIQFWPG